MEMRKGGKRKVPEFQSGREKQEEKLERDEARKGRRRLEAGGTRRGGGK